LHCFFMLVHRVTNVHSHCFITLLLLIHYIASVPSHFFIAMLLLICHVVNVGVMSWCRCYCLFVVLLVHYVVGGGVVGVTFSQLHY